MKGLVIFLFVLSAFARNSNFSKKSFSNGDAQLFYYNSDIDWFNPMDTRTYRQRYWINDKYFSNGGPVFMLLGGESAATPAWAETGAMVNYAKKHGALIAQAEHRFYGRSQPFGDLSMDSLRYLTSEQALGDYAAIATTIKAKYSTSKLIAFGGSYSGNLAAWFRMKYPGIVHGAIASSAPVLAKVDFVEYLEVASKSMASTEKYGENCANAIKNATSHIETLLHDSSSIAELERMFQIQGDLRKPDDAFNFMSTLSQNVASLVQYALDNRSFEGVKDVPTIEAMCDAVMYQDAQTPIEGYVRLQRLAMNYYEQTEMNVDYRLMINEMRNTSLLAPAAQGGRQWQFQTCNEFGYYQTTSSLNQIFGSMVPLSFYLKQCAEIYDSSFTASQVQLNVDRTNMIYGGLDGANSLSRVVYPNGSIDEWHALGVITGNKSIFIDGTAHCANEYPPRDSDLQSLTRARNTISTYINDWLQQSDDNSDV